MNNADYLATAKKHISEITFWSNLIKDASGNEFIKVVRCRDCNEYIQLQGYAMCGYFGGDYAEIEPDGFCAWGVREDGDAR